MAAQAATTLARPTDVGAKLRADKKQAERQRSKASGMNYLRGAVLGASLASVAPQVPQSFPDDAPSSAQGWTSGETYQRAFRQRQITNQIDESVGLDLNRRADVENSSPIDDIQQDYGSREAELMRNNQQGLDTRSAAAKRSERSALQETGLSEGFQSLQDSVQKELNGWLANLAGDAVEGIDTAFEDMGLSQGLALTKNVVQVTRTILSPAPDNSDIHNLSDLKTQAQEKFLDALAPRLGLSGAGIAGWLGIMYQTLLAALPIVAATALIFLIVTFAATGIGGIILAYTQFAQNPTAANYANIVSAESSAVVDTVASTPVPTHSR